jgi:TolB-like protein/Flp pilus assembly protein TadD
MHVPENKVLPSYGMPAAELDSNAVRSQLERVLTSGCFRRNQRLGRFLRFVVELRLEGKESEIKESVIAIEVFGRKADHNPKQDSIVRTEAVRLRARLMEYYVGEGQRDSLIIELPKGGYAPIFVRPQVEPSHNTAQQPPPADAAAPGSSPRGNRRKIVQFALAALAILAGLGTWTYNRFLAHPTRIHSLAVLPLENLSGDQAQDYFADGVTDELITQLAKIASVKVISRTSVMQYKAVHTKPLPQVARELGVDAVVEGTIGRSGDQVHITVQLIEAATDQHIWADRYERNARDILILEDEIAGTIAAQLRGKINRQDEGYVAAGPIDPAAHEAYLQGRYLWTRRTPAALEQAIADFTQAIEKEPRYAEAYTGRADAYIVVGGFGMESMPPAIALSKASADAEQAVKLDANSAEAHTARAVIRHIYDRDSRAAEAEFQRALELSPSDATARQWYSQFLCNLERFDECVAEAARAHTLDPAYLTAGVDVGYRLYEARRYREAIDPIRKILEFNPDFALGHRYLGQVYEANRRYPESIAELRRAVDLSGGAPIDIATLGHAYALSGQRGKAQEALQTLDQLATRRYVSSYGRALIYAGLGENASALNWLERAFDDHSSWIVKLKVDSRLDPLRQDKHFNDLVHRAGLTQ